MNSGILFVIIFLAAFIVIIAFFIHRARNWQDKGNDSFSNAPDLDNLEIPTGHHHDATGNFDIHHDD